MQDYVSPDPFLQLCFPPWNYKTPSYFPGKGAQSYDLLGNMCVFSTFLKWAEIVLSSQNLYSRKYKIILYQGPNIYTFIPNCILPVSFESKCDYMIQSEIHYYIKDIKDAILT